MRPATQNDGTLMYEYFLLYTDNCLVVPENAESVLKKEIGRYFELKSESIGPPSLYFGGHHLEVTFYTGVKAWYFVSTQHIQSDVKNVE